MTEQNERYENIASSIATLAIDDAAIYMGSRPAAGFTSIEYVVYSVFGGPFDVAVYSNDADAYADFQKRAAAFLAKRDLI